MTATDEFYKLFRKLNQRLERMLHQNHLDSYDEKLNPAIRPISACASHADRKESTFKVKRPFRVTKIR
jgi:hypothetical protein